MSEPGSSRSSQRNKKDKNQLSMEELKGFTNFQICDNGESKTIEMLNSDCLEHIFKILPLVDLFRVQRVCKYWRRVSLYLCRRITRLEMSRQFWGVSSNGNIHIDFDAFKSVLNVCGPNLHYIGFPNTEDIYRKVNRRVHVESNKLLWILISAKCPALTSIDFGKSGSTAALKIISHTYNKLTHFTMKKFTLPGNSPLVHETHLGHIFANNKNLKRVDVYETELTTECLAKLNSANLEELTLTNCTINSSEHLVKALKKLKKLNKITMTHCLCLQDTWINNVLEALASISDGLKYLDFYLYNPQFEIIDSTYFGKLEQLEYLCITGNTIATDDALIVIAKFCKKLRKLKIHNSGNVTDIGVERLAIPTELKSLILDTLPSLTDEVLQDMGNIVNLEVRYCGCFKNNGFFNLIRNSRNIRKLEIFNCKEINEFKLIEVVERCSNDNLEFIIDTSEMGYDYVECVYKVIKSNGNVTKVIKKHCSECFRVNKRNQPCLCCNIVHFLKA